MGDGIGSILGGVGSLIGGIGSVAGPAIGGVAAGAANPPVSQSQPGSFNPPSGSGIAYNYIPTGQPAADKAAQNQLGYTGGSAQLAQMLANPMLAQLLRSFTNDPTISGLNTAAGQAGQQAGAFGNQMLLQGNALQQSALSALPQFQQILAQGTDPQSALYDRTLKQVQDQIGANLAQTGLTGSGAGAAVANQGISNFNIDWQNQQLARALSAMQGYGTGIGQLGSTVGAGAGLQQQGIGDIAAAGALPYQANQTAMGGQQSALANFLSSIGASQGLGSNAISSLLSYLNTGQNANAIANNAAGANASNVNQQNSNAAAGLGGLISGGSNALGSALQALFQSGGGSTPTPIGGFGTDPYGQLTANFTSFGP